MLQISQVHNMMQLLTEKNNFSHEATGEVLGVKIAYTKFAYKLNASNSSRQAPLQASFLCLQKKRIAPLLKPSKNCQKELFL